MKVTDMEKRTEKASTILYQYACEMIDTAEAKARCLENGFAVDFRQKDYGAAFEVLDLLTNNFITIEV